MLEEKATVIKVDAKHIWVEAESRSGCGQCSSSSCNTSVLAKLFNLKPNLMKLENHIEAKSGDQVLIAIPDQVLVKAALWIYLLPLLAMLTSTLLSNQLGANEAVQGIFGLMGLAIGFALVNIFTTHKQQFKPQILRQKKSTQFINLETRNKL